MPLPEPRRKAVPSASALPRRLPWVILPFSKICFVCSALKMMSPFLYEISSAPSSPIVWNVPPRIRSSLPNSPTKAVPEPLVPQSPFANDTPFRVVPFEYAVPRAWAVPSAELFHLTVPVAVKLVLTLVVSLPQATMPVACFVDDAYESTAPVSLSHFTVPEDSFF